MKSDPAISMSALVVRRIAYGETDLIVHFVTPEAGRISGFARAARRSRHRFPSGFPILAALEIRVGAPHRAEGLRQIHECHVVRSNRAIAGDLMRYAAGNLALELVRETFPEDHPEPEAFEAVASYLSSLDDGPFAPDRLLAAEMRILAPLGMAPQLARCVVCDREAPPGRAAFFDAARGGIVCRQCGGAERVLSGPARDLLLAAAGPALGNEPRPSATLDELIAAHRALLAFLEFHLGRRIRTARFFEEAIAADGRRQ